MGDNGEGRVKNLKKWVISFMDGSLLAQLSAALFWYYPKATSSIWNFEIIFSFMILAYVYNQIGFGVLKFLEGPNPDVGFIFQFCSTCWVWISFYQIMPFFVECGLKSSMKFKTSILIFKKISKLTLICQASLTPTLPQNILPETPPAQYRESPHKTSSHRTNFSIRWLLKYFYSSQSTQ